jgi:hypothetical protein
MTISSKNTIASRIRAYLRENPKAKPDEVVKALGVKRENVYSLKQYDRLRAKRIRAKKKAVDWQNLKAGDVVGGMVLTEAKDNMHRWVKAPADTLPIVMFDPVDNVNHPEHYKVGGIETIDFIKAKLTPEEFRGYLKGNVLKYASRAGHKNNAVEDAGKLAWYANRLSKES